MCATPYSAHPVHLPNQQLRQFWFLLQSTSQKSYFMIIGLRGVKSKCIKSYAIDMCNYAHTSHRSPNIIVYHVCTYTQPFTSQRRPDTVYNIIMVSSLSHQPKITTDKVAILNVFIVLYLLGMRLRPVFHQTEKHRKFIHLGMGFHIRYTTAYIHAILLLFPIKSEKNPFSNHYILLVFMYGTI